MPRTGDAAAPHDPDLADRPHLEASVIGTPRLVWREADGEAELELPSKPFALLCWLALHAVPIAKDDLAELFWGPGKRHNLRVALHALRKLPGADVWLRAESETVTVAATSDLARFERALEANEPEPAVAVWRAGAGERPADSALLAGVEAANAPAFGDALEEARRWWAERYRAALGAAARALEGRGERAAALARLDDALAIDPLDEALARRAIWLEDALGNRPAALARYERLRRELAAELEVQPAAATRELYEALLAADQGRVASARATDPLAALRGSRRTPFVARESELATIERVFESERWVTLLGPGGVGKSRLALEYASRLGAASDVGVVAFERLADPTAWPEAVAHALGVPLPGGGPAAAQLEAGLRGRAALLVLDGLEAAHAVWPALAELADAAPRLRVLATSRVRLGLPTERVVPVAPLAVQGDDGPVGDPLANDPLATDPLATDAGRLLLAAARRDDAGYAPGARERRALARIGRAVEGMPLGLELAAGWLRLYGAERLADRIETDPLALEDPDAPEGGRDPAAAIARSWALLPEAVRRTLAALTVFRGGFDAPAALAVSGDDDPRALLALVDASLLLRDGDGRFDLHAGVRRWAAARIGTGLGNAAGERHARFFLESWLPGAADPSTGEAGGERLKRERIELEHDNLMTAWRWACDAADAVLIGAALDPMALYLRAGERNEEGRSAMAQAVAVLDGAEDGVEDGAVRLAARARVRQAWFASITGRNDDAVTALEAALPALGDAPQLQADARRNLGAALSNLGRFEAAASQLEAAAATFEAAGDRLNLARTCNYLGIDAVRRGDPAAAKSHYRACLTYARDAGSELGVASALANLGEVELHQGNLEEAQSLLDEAFERFAAQGYRNGEATTTMELGLLDLRRRQRDAGRARLRAALEIYRALGRVREQAEVHAELARLGGEEGRHHAEAALALSRRIGHPTTEAVALARLAALERDAGRRASYRATLAEARRVAGARAAPRLVAALRDAEESAEAS